MQVISKIRDFPFFDPLYTNQLDILQMSIVEVAIGCTVKCRVSAIIYRVLELMAIIN